MTVIFFWKLYRFQLRSVHLPYHNSEEKTTKNYLKSSQIHPKTVTKPPQDHPKATPKLPGSRTWPGNDFSPFWEALGHPLGTLLRYFNRPGDPGTQKTTHWRLSVGGPDFRPDFPHSPGALDQKNKDSVWEG